MIPDLKSPCHGEELYVQIIYNADEGDTVSIWCMDPGCHNTWDGKGKSQDN